MKLSKGTILAIAFGLFILAIIVYQTMGLRQYECQVCMELDGRTACKTVKGQNQDQAMQGAKDNDCADIGGDRAQLFRCNQSPPASFSCKHL